MTIVGWATAWMIIGIPVLVGVAIWALVDGIVLLAKGGSDRRGLQLR